jgi:hypothetical protein
VKVLLMPSKKPTDNTSLAERERRRLQDTITSLRRELASTTRELNAQTDLRSALFGLTAEPLQPRIYSLRPEKVHGEAEIPILFTSDFQWGEVASLEQLAGLNSFNKRIASARYRRLIETTIELCTKHHAGKPPPRFYYLRGGDAISGEIHMELAKTNDLLSLGALKDCAEHEAWGIEQLHKELGCPIEVISVPGNHGRTTLKPESKGYVDTSYDDLLAWHLESYFRGNKDVRFSAPRSGDAPFTVHNTRFLLTHGDRIGSRGGQGFVGPAATIARGMKKLVDQYAGTGQLFDVILVGHFHTSLKLEHGYSNGSLPGFTEYARDLRVKPKPPTQWLFHVHPRRGIVCEREIMVGGNGEGMLCEVPQATRKREAPKA